MGQNKGRNYKCEEETHGEDSVTIVGERTMATMGPETHDPETSDPNQEPDVSESESQSEDDLI